MAKSGEYYFSTLVMSEEGSASRPTVIITSKKIWDSEKRLDYYAVPDKEYAKIHKLLKKPKSMAEAMENYFQPIEPMSCEELKSYLGQKRFIYNSELDCLLEEFLRLGR